MDACLLTQKMKCTFSIHSIKFEFSFFPVILNIFSVHKRTETRVCLLCKYIYLCAISLRFLCILIEIYSTSTSLYVWSKRKPIRNVHTNACGCSIAVSFIRNENIYTIASVRFTSSKCIHIHYARIFCSELWWYMHAFRS